MKTTIAIIITVIGILVLAKAAEPQSEDRKLIREAVEKFARKSKPRTPDHIFSHTIFTSKGRLNIYTAEAKKNQDGRYYTEGKSRPTGYFLVPHGAWAKDAEEAERMLLEDYEKGKLLPSDLEATPEPAAGKGGGAGHPSQTIKKIPQEARATGDEDVAFFEKTYGKKIEGVKPIGEYDDPDTYYSEIAKQLGIPKIAFDAAAKQFAWAEGDGKESKAVVKRIPGQWQVMIMRFKINPNTGKPDAKSIEVKSMTLDDKGKATFPE
jgi:hypothetical protein